LREAEVHNAMLENDNMKVLLEESNEEMEQLREIVQGRDGDKDGDEDGMSGREHLRRGMEELEGYNEELRGKVEEQAEVIALRKDEKEDLADETEALWLDIEEIQRRRDAESLERSQSRAQILEEREERRSEFAQG
jgi:hypothetical protein